ncbi:ECF transporter S component [Metamycoplasma equirhinis]|uniref:ECF transporter S component n=1 Tax=Metamycoplasma equirhinis TaxID=92402 RepID=UPI0035937F52
MISFFQNIRRKIKTKSYRFTIYDIALFGVLLAIYVLASVFERYVFAGTFKIGITYAIFIVFGLALGPFKGAFLGVLCDTISQIIHGIGTWMIEYAIIPVLISFISGFFIQLILKRNNWNWIVGYIILTIVTIIFTVILIVYGHKLPINEHALKTKKIIPWKTAMTIGIIGIVFIWISSLIFSIINVTTKKVKVKANVSLLFSILILVFLVLIISRWLWGPFAYINYRNRFRAANWDYETYFPIFMIPIIFKSLLEIPIYSIVIFSIYPILLLIRQKIHFHSNKIHTF